MWPRMGSQNKAHDWVNKKGEQASCHLWPSSEAERQVHDSQWWKSWRPLHLVSSGCNSCQAVTRLPVANHILLESWMVHISQESHRLRPAPLKRHMGHLGLVRSLHTRDRGEAWTWEVMLPWAVANFSVFYPAGVLTTYSKWCFCFQSHSSSTAQLSQWSWISGHIFPLVPGQRLYTEDTCKQRRLT